MIDTNVDVENFVIFNECSLSEAIQYEDIKRFVGLFMHLERMDMGKLLCGTDLRSYCIGKRSFFNFFDWMLKDDKDLRKKLKIIFINHSVVEKELSSEDISYLHNNKTCFGLALAHRYQTFAMSFCSQSNWEASRVSIEERRGDKKTSIEVKNLSKIEHISEYGSFFEPFVQKVLNKIEQSGQRNFWDNQDKYFKNVIFCEETKKQFKGLDSRVFMEAIEKLLFLEYRVKKYEDFKWKDESKSVKNWNSSRSPNKTKRSFTKPHGKKILIYKHCVLPEGHRLYCCQEGNEFIVGHIGEHLETKNF